METAEIGIIGGSGLYEMAGFEAAREVELDTPFGAPSDRLRVGRRPSSPATVAATGSCPAS
jgi:5'-methylthioadenosine phosphorylase